MRSWVALRTRKICASRGCHNVPAKGAKLCKKCIVRLCKSLVAKTRSGAIETTNLYAIVTDDPFFSFTPSVKFGVASDPAARLKELQTGSFIKLKLYGYVSCVSSLERILHSKLSRHRRQGEWFTVSFDVRKVMGWVASKKADKIYEYCGLGKFRKLLDPQEIVPR